MSAIDIADKLWKLCNVLRDDGVTYHQYLNELTYILFLRLSEIRGFESEIPEEYRWSKIKGIKDNKDLFDTYRELLATISKKSENAIIKEIYTNASTTLRKPVNLRTLVTNINDIDWYDEQEQDKIATIYEELLEKNASEKKSGAGQYFTPRPLINVMVELMVPKIGERWNDPAAGTFGFMIAADQYLKDKTDHYFELSATERKFQKEKAFSGCELVQDAHRLALMNAKLHGLDSKIELGDALSELGKNFKNYDGVLANPPFGTKKGGERPSRDDFTYPTSNKQLNFLQHIYRSLNKNGGARAAVVLPDNVLFEGNDGQKIRRDLMDKCNLHTILRLPTGIFYAQGVKTNVLFFERGKTEKDNTKSIWFYDMRTGIDSYGKRTPFTREAFAGFVKAYTGGIGIDALRKNYNGVIDDRKREKIIDERWTRFSRKDISANSDSLDVGLLNEVSINAKYVDKEPLDLAKQAAGELMAIQFELNKIIELTKVWNKNNKNGKNFETLRVKDIAAKIQYGYTESSTLEAIGPKFLRITDIQNGKVDWDSVPFCKISIKDKEKYLLNRGDILFARTGATVGKSYLIEGEISEAVFASYLIRITLKEKYFPKYIWYFFNSTYYWKQILASAKGIGQPNVNGTVLGELKVPVPSFEEQKEIAKQLENLFSNLNHLLEKHNSLKSLFESLSNSALTQAFMGKLVK